MTLHPLIPSHLDQLMLKLAGYVAKALLLLIFYMGKSHGHSTNFICRRVDFFSRSCDTPSKSKSPKMLVNSISTMDSLSLVNLQEKIT
jgi:hypothetical protein